MIFEDEHLLAVDKPAGWNTHAPSPFAGEGIYDWFRHREPRWSGLAIIHRLDKEVSGVLLFGKTPLANRSLTQQFAERRVRKRYLLLTDHPVSRTAFTVRTRLARAGARYQTVVDVRRGQSAETRFRVLGTEAGRTLCEAEPVTGRTHQIRVHAAEQGFPILGDALYCGTPWSRVCLHAEGIQFAHPVSNQPMVLRAPETFQEDVRHALRRALIDPSKTDAYRLIHGASDGWPGWYVDRFGHLLLSQSETELDAGKLEELKRLTRETGIQCAYHKRLSRQVRRKPPQEASPQLLLGSTAPEHILVKEEGVRYELSIQQGYSVGLFLDQRDNRRRLRTSHVAAGFRLTDAEPHCSMSDLRVLNTFAYTCAFSVCAALAGARTTSLDLSRRHLEWGKRNFELNGVDLADHDFIYGDALDWLRRLARKEKQYDVVILDPPTFSQSRQSGVFRAEKDYGKLVRAVLPLLPPGGGVLFASTNASGWTPEDFLDSVTEAAQSKGRRILNKCYFPQPPDFPVSRPERAYLKTAWFRLG